MARREFWGKTLTVGDSNGHQYCGTFLPESNESNKGGAFASVDVDWLQAQIVFRTITPYLTLAVVHFNDTQQEKVGNECVAPFMS
jgi:hypothetical protein